jgi:hypothetical protein
LAEVAKFFSKKFFEPLAQMTGVVTFARHLQKHGQNESSFL